MKIAIRGHESRGKEVIQILKSLGGNNSYYHEGSCINLYYFITESGVIDFAYKENFVKNYNFYTLEEFEKEFPFKIGDKVKYISDNEIGTIHRFINISTINRSTDELMYVVKFEKSGYGYIPAEELKPYKEMKEERNITLTLDKAKEWYKKGGELKEVALQAYSEEELNPLPRSWEEFVESTKFTFNGNLEFINEFGQWSNGCLSNKSIGESSKIWNKYVALFQLEQLRDCWRQGWIPNCYDDQQTKYCVGCHRGKFKISVLNETSRFLSFPTYEMAEEFLKCFRELIEKAGDLI